MRSHLNSCRHMMSNWLTLRGVASSILVRVQACRIKTHRGNAMSLFKYLIILYQIIVGSIMLLLIYKPSLSPINVSPIYR
jgi:hypothetical protein